MDFTEIKDLEQKYIIHTYGRADVALKSGKGATARDYDGNEYIDFTAGIGVNSLGWCDPDWVKAVSKQAGKLQHTSNYYYNKPNVKLAELLTEASGLSKAFFCNSGAEANECAVKIARKYGEARGAYKIVTLNNSFHGRTLTTLAATGQNAFHKDFLPLTDGFVYADANIESARAALDDKVCAVLIETVQGEGGVVPMDENFVQALRALCNEKNVLLMIDEVQTGVGRTGYFYSYQGYGILPDIATTAKGLAGGLPVGACLVSRKLADILKPGMNGSTFGGNPVVCAGACEVVKRVNDDSFLENVREKGAYIRKKLEKMEGVEFTRGRGMMIGIKLRGIDAHDMIEKCAKNGLLVLTAKELVRFLPPLTITKDEIDRGLYIFENTLNCLKA